MKSPANSRICRLAVGGLALCGPFVAGTGGGGFLVYYNARSKQSCCATVSRS